MSCGSNEFVNVLGVLVVLGLIVPGRSNEVTVEGPVPGPPSTPTTFGNNSSKNTAILAPASAAVSPQTSLAHAQACDRFLAHAQACDSTRQRRFVAMICRLGGCLEHFVFP
jgi:hypothetical protein